MKNREPVFTGGDLRALLIGGPLLAAILAWDWVAPVLKTVGAAVGLVLFAPIYFLFVGFAALSPVMLMMLICTVAIITAIEQKR